MARPKRAAAKKANYAEILDPEVLGDLTNGDDSDDYIDTEKGASEDDDVIMVDETEEDDLEEGIEEIEEPDDEPKKKSKSKTTTKKATENKKKEKKTKKPASSKPAATPKRDVKGSKQLTSIKDRLTRLFGTNTAKLAELVNLRKDWEIPLFQFDVSQLKETPQYPEFKLPEIQFNALTEIQFKAKFALTDIPKKFQLENGDIKSLGIGSKASDDTTLVLNTGGLITDIAWLIGPDNSNEQILAVSLNNLTESANSPEFSLLTTTSYPGVIQLYKVNTETHSFELYKTYLHNWGGAWNLRPAPIQFGVGALSAVFNDGSIRVLGISDDTPPFQEVTKASLEFSIEGDQITSFDWNGPLKIIAGTHSGNVAEFVLEDEDPAPSFLYPVHSDYIFSIAASTSTYDDPTIYTSCSDGTSAIFSTVDIPSSINRTTKSKAVSKTVEYCPHVYSFIQLEGHYTIKVVPARALFASQSLVKHDGSAESVGVSPLHPLVLSGGADGKVKIHNVARRVLNGQKQTLKSHKILTLLELQYGALEDTFRLVRPLDVETLNAVDAVNAVNIFPPQVSICSIKWNSNKNSGNWFAAGSTSGLLILHYI